METTSIPPADPSRPAAPFPPPPASSPRETERELRDLRYLLSITMTGLVVLLLTTTLGLFHQIRWLVSQAGQLNGTVVELTKAVTEYETNTVPQMGRLFAEFQRFAQTNADFAKIMSRYRVVNDASGTNGAASSTGLPGVASP